MTDDRAGEIREGVAPLFDVFWVTPAGRLGFDIKLRAFGEGQHILVGGSCGDLPGAFVGQRVDTLTHLFRFSCRQVACFGECHVGIRAEPQPGILAETGVAKYPGLGDRISFNYSCRWADLQLQVATVGVLVRTFVVLHKQSSDSLRHTQLLALRLRSGPRFEPGFGRISSTHPSAEESLSAR